MCEFFKEQQLEIILDALPDKWDSVRKVMKPRLSFIEFNPLADEMLLEREHQQLERERQYTAMGIRMYMEKT